MSNHTSLTKTQQKLYRIFKELINSESDTMGLKKEIETLVDSSDSNYLLEVLTATESQDDNTVTLLSRAIISDKPECLEFILKVAEGKDTLKKVLINPNITVKFSNSQEHTETPLGCAILLGDLVKIKDILGVAAKDKDILKEVLASANITIIKDGENYTVTPLGYATCFNDREKIVKAILNAAKEHNILKEVWAGEEFYREEIKAILQKAEDSDMLNEISRVEKIIESEAVKENPFSNENVKQPKNTAKTTNKPMIIGSVCGVIAALAVIVGCFAAGVALPILAIAGIAVATALGVGLAAYGITHAISRPSSVTDNPNVNNLDVTNQINS